MNDMISRQDAIDAIEERIKANGYVNVALISELNRLYGYIRQLPSAQLEIIRCKDCKHGRTYNHTKEYVSCEVDCDPIDRDSDFFCKDGERRE